VSATELAQHGINALSIGSTYALIALGLAIVFSILRLINFAHGELVTITGYVMYWLVSAHVTWFAVVPAAIGAAIVAAVLMERVAFRPVRGASITTMLITSFAVSATLQGIFLVFISPRPKPVPTPDWMNENVTIGSLQIQNLQLVTAGATAVALAAIGLFLRRSITGTAMRAAAEDFAVTRLMGIRANLVIVAAFALSGALAGVAGILWIAQRGTVEPTTGLAPVLSAFIATVIGGFGSLGGAVLGGFAFGAVEVAFGAFLPESLLSFQHAFALVSVVVIFLARPQGLLPARAERV
jgi:branched-chain amino acid transport system permease protein